jgi:hypothetical protein
MRAFARLPWEGDAKLVIGIDIGTTFCAVSYSCLIPQGPQTVQRVIKWPGQHAQKGEAKIPSIVWYDKRGRPKSFGAEACLPETELKAEDERWGKAEHFKLHLHPATMRSSMRPEALPYGKTAQDIYADLLQYLYKHTEHFFVETELDGRALWDELQKGSDIVIAHPNGWGVHEQILLRKAAVKAGLIKEKESNDRIHFVTEAEASVHHVMFHSKFETRLKPGFEFIVCDAGGSTVDTTSYVVKSVTPHLKLEETRASACIQAGAIFVNRRAKPHFEHLFQTAGHQPQFVALNTQSSLESFEAETKKAFDGAEDTVIVNIGNHRVSAPKINLNRGLLTLQGLTVKTFFDEPVGQILESLHDQMEGQSIQSLLLVGGFGESPYLRRRLRSGPCSDEIDLTVANDSTAKAVADGAVIWFAKQAVGARVPRFAFGCDQMARFNASDPRHRGRKTFQNRDGTFVTGVWSVIAQQNQVVQNGEECKRPYYRAFDNPWPDLQITSDIYAWTGKGAAPYFIFDGNHMTPGFRKVCKVSADLSSLGGKLKKYETAAGRYWQVLYDIGFTFGATELKAFIMWEEDGKPRRAPATIIPYRFA